MHWAQRHELALREPGSREVDAAQPVWKSTSELGCPSWRVNGDNVASMAWKLYVIEQT
jgi:hypothetical protein